MAELRMRDLTRRTGLSRQAIHFYVEQGLLAPPHKTGETMGYYDEAHVERILLIRKLQEEHFLPLKMIRAMLDDETGALTAAQQRVLRDVKAKLPRETTHVDDSRHSLTELLGATGLTRADVRELERAGLIEVDRGKVSADHAWLIELWGEVRAAGFTRELGLGPELLQSLERGIQQIFDDQQRVLARLAALLPAARVAEMVERALPMIHRYLVRSHETKVHALFARVGAA